MAVLRRVLYLQALTWGVVGLGLALLPRLILQVALRQPPLGEQVWARLFGLESVVLALLMVLVAHRLEDLWWWSWAFVFMTAGVAGLFTLNALFGLPEGANPVMWWVGAAGAWAFAVALLRGLSETARELGPPTA